MERGTPYPLPPSGRGDGGILKNHFQAPGKMRMVKDLYLFADKYPTTN